MDMACRYLAKFYKKKDSGSMAACIRAWEKALIDAKLASASSELIAKDRQKLTGISRRIVIRIKELLHGAYGRAVATWKKKSLESKQRTEMTRMRYRLHVGAMKALIVWVRRLQCVMLTGALRGWMNRSSNEIKRGVREDLKAMASEQRSYTSFLASKMKEEQTRAAMRQVASIALGVGHSKKSLTWQRIKDNMLRERQAMEIEAAIVKREANNHLHLKTTAIRELKMIVWRLFKAVVQERLEIWRVSKGVAITEEVTRARENATLDSNLLQIQEADMKAKEKVGELLENEKKKAEKTRAAMEEKLKVVQVSGALRQMRLILGDVLRSERGKVLMKMRMSMHQDQQMREVRELQQVMETQMKTTAFMVSQLEANDRGGHCKAVDQKQDRAINDNVREIDPPRAKVSPNSKTVKTASEVEALTLELRAELQRVAKHMV